MKFRAKFQAVGLLWFPLPCLYGIFWLSWRHSNFPHSSLYGLTAILWTVTALLWFFRTNFIYWELDSSSLRAFWLGKQRNEIAWLNVTRVGLENYQHPSSCCLVIDCIHPGPMIERKTILVDPRDREEFLATLRGFAPQATFDV